MPTYRAVEDRVALIKIEGTYGVDPTPDETNAVLLLNSSVTLEADKLERNIDLPYFGGNPFVLVGKRATLEGEIEMMGAAAMGDAAPIGIVLKGCGHSEVLVVDTSASYKPKSRTLQSVHVYFYWAGLLFKLSGTRGTLDREIGIKGYSKGKFKFTGKLSIPTEAEAPAGIDLSTFQSPIAVETESWGVAIDDTTVNAYSLSITQGADVKMIEGSERRSVEHTDRKGSGVVRVFKDIALASFDPYALAESHAITTIASTVVPASSPDGRAYRESLYVQFEYPKQSSVDGIACLDLAFVTVPVAGDDEYTISFF